MEPFRQPLLAEDPSGTPFRVRSQGFSYCPVVISKQGESVKRANAEASHLFSAMSASIWLFFIFIQVLKHN